MSTFSLNDMMSALRALEIRSKPRAIRRNSRGSNANDNSNSSARKMTRPVTHVFVVIDSGHVGSKRIGKSERTGENNNSRKSVKR